MKSLKIFGIIGVIFLFISGCKIEDYEKFYISSGSIDFEEGKELYFYSEKLNKKLESGDVIYYTRSGENTADADDLDVKLWSSLEIRNYFAEHNLERPDLGLTVEDFLWNKRATIIFREDNKCYYFSKDDSYLKYK